MVIQKPENVLKNFQNAFKPFRMVAPHPAFEPLSCFSRRVVVRRSCPLPPLLGSSCSSGTAVTPAVIDFTNSRSPFSSVFAMRVECPCSSNSMFEPPVSGSRSSVKFGACAIAVPVACHIPNCGEPLASVTDIDRARPSKVDTGFSAILETLQCPEDEIWCVASEMGEGECRIQCNACNVRESLAFGRCSNDTKYGRRFVGRDTRSASASERRDHSIGSPGASSVRRSD